MTQEEYTLRERQIELVRFHAGMQEFWSKHNSKKKDKRDAAESAAALHAAADALERETSYKATATWRKQSESFCR